MSTGMGKTYSRTRRLPQLPGAVVFPISYQSSTEDCQPEFSVLLSATPATNSSTGDNSAFYSWKVSIGGHSDIAVL